jgi:hypothetical protein
VPGTETERGKTVSENKQHRIAWWLAEAFYYLSHSNATPLDAAMTAVRRVPWTVAGQPSTVVEDQELVLRKIQAALNAQ